MDERVSPGSSSPDPSSMLKGSSCCLVGRVEARSRNRSKATTSCEMMGGVASSLALQASKRGGESTGGGDVELDDSASPPSLRLDDVARWRFLVRARREDRVRVRVCARGTVKRSIGPGEKEAVEGRRTKATFDDLQETARSKAGNDPRERYIKKSAKLSQIWS